MTGLIMSAYVGILSPNGHAMSPNDAPRYALKAVYKQLELDKSVRQWEKRHINIAKYNELLYIGIITRIVVEKRVSYRWEF